MNREFTVRIHIQVMIQLVTVSHSDAVSEARRTRTAVTAEVPMTRTVTS